jgi:hypothetical protein
MGTVGRAGLLITTAIAWVGVVVGHLAACVLAYPNEAVRHVHLEAAGHTWVRLAVPSLWAVIPVILLVVAVGAVRKTTASPGSGMAIRLAAVQVPAFLLIELVVQDGGLGHILGDPAVFVGLVLQPVIAVVAAWLLDLIGRAVRVAVARLRTGLRQAASPSVCAPVLGQTPPRWRLLLPVGRRAPPLPALA